MVEASSKNNKVRAIAVAKNQKNAVEASNSEAKFYAQNAREWAISESLVDNEDYSSKYYAGKSKEDKEAADLILQNTRETARQALADIDLYKTNTLTTFSEVKDEALTAFSDKETEVLGNIETAETTAITDIQAEGQAQRDTLQGDVDTAVQKASEAAQSATIALASEANARDYADAALLSKNAAATSETNAKTSEDNAKASEEAASTYAGETLQYATNAQTFSETATTQAGIATTKATQAANSATASANSASAALTSEQNARHWAEQSQAGQKQSDWEQTDTTEKDYIKNKPTKVSDFQNDAQYLSATDTVKVTSVSLEEYNNLSEKDQNTLYVVLTNILVWGSSLWGTGNWELGE